MRRLPHDRFSLIGLRTPALGILLACTRLTLAAQEVTPSPSSTSAGPEPTTEMAVKQSESSSIEEAAKLRVNVRLVLARVVVRNVTGHAVGNLRKEDFEIFDNGKRQVISNFDAETAVTSASAMKAGKTSVPGEITPASSGSFPSRYVAYVFDDQRLSFGDLARVREAAKRRIDQLSSTDRVAIFSTSGQSMLDFTDDRGKLRETLVNLEPRPLVTPDISKCPDISFFMADQIVNKNDPQALQLAVNDFINCAHVPPQATASVPTVVRGMATQVLNVGQDESRMTLRVLNDIIRRMAVLPGRRMLVLVSPGFLTAQLEYDYENLIDRALRGQVVVNSLDARELYVVIPGGDASQKGHADVDVGAGTSYAPSRALLEINSATAEGDILDVLANNTGGVSFKNNNDMDEGFRRVADSPEYYYVLSFKPQNLKSDGKFHTLKITLTNHQKYDVQARRGYFAPKHDVEVKEEARREIEDEVFSSEELHDLPVALHTEFFKPTDDAAKLTVLARVDVKRLHYRQSNERNWNELTVVTAVFDRNGNFVQADQKTLEMRWKNETLQTRLNSGVTLKTNFNVKPGRYLVRLVARDSQQQVMFAENGAVEIP